MVRWFSLVHDVDWWPVNIEDDDGNANPLSTVFRSGRQLYKYKAVLTQSVNLFLNSLLDKD